MFHPSAELRFVNAQVGHGVFATRRIPRGTIVWVRCALDIELTPEAVVALGPAYQRIVPHYGYPEANGHWIICWDNGRYLSHSCEPTCLKPGFDLQIALRDIEEGEQFTYDYGALNPDPADEPFRCLCGAPGCRGRVTAEDAERLAPDWDARLAAAFPDVLGVEQPLWPFVRDPAAVEACARGEQALPSCRLHFRPPAQSRWSSSMP